MSFIGSAKRSLEEGFAFSWKAAVDWMEIAGPICSLKHPESLKIVMNSTIAEV